MENRIDLARFEGHVKGPWRYEMPPEEGMVIMAGETMVAELSLLMSNMSPETDDVNTTGLNPDAADARLILASPDLHDELKRCYEELDEMYKREDKLLGWIEGTITEAKDYVTYDEEDEMWVFDESKSSNPALDAMDFVIDLATTDLKSI